MSTHVYQFVGPSNSVVSGATGVLVSGGAIAPLIKREWTIANDENKPDLDSALAIFGWVPSAAPLPMVELAHARVRLTSDGAAIPFAAGWVSVIDLPITTEFAGSTLRVIASMLGSVTLGGQMRIMIDGGGYDNAALIDPISLPVLTTVGVAWCGSVDAPTVATYTIRLQASGTIALSSVTPQAGCSLEIDERSP